MGGGLESGVRHSGLLPPYRSYCVDGPARHLRLGLFGGLSQRSLRLATQVNKQLGDNIFLTQLDAAASWARANSLWPMPFATACCGIELMSTAASKHDLSRFGSEVMRFSPRQCDLMIVAGRVVMKMIPVLQRIWLQMPEPKWCISMGACACSGGVFDTYAVVQGIDRFIPVDVYVPGCPPRPEQLIRSILDLQDKIKKTGTYNAREFQLRILSDGPSRFDEDELLRIRERNGLKLEDQKYDPIH
ncbi:MAG: NADH-quinone oxidoreductase subunit B [Planctomycetes bacterium]|nr:NADH-quinone oxidoreductase subunit B [Planctomycetota bacterium]